MICASAQNIKADKKVPGNKLGTFFGGLLKVKFKIVFLNPADLSENEAECPRKNSRKNKADKNKSEPVECCNGGF